MFEKPVILTEDEQELLASTRAHFRHVLDWEMTMSEGIYLKHAIKRNNQRFDELESQGISGPSPNMESILELLFQYYGIDPEAVFSGNKVDALPYSHWEHPTKRGYFSQEFKEYFHRIRERSLEVIY